MILLVPENHMFVRCARADLETQVIWGDTRGVMEKWSSFSAVSPTAASPPTGETASDFTKRLTRVLRAGWSTRVWCVARSFRVSKSQAGTARHVAKTSRGKRWWWGRPCASCVTKSSPAPINLPHTWRGTKESWTSLAVIVTKCLRQLPPSTNTSFLIRNHFNVNFVRSCFQERTTWQLIFKLTSGELELIFSCTNFHTMCFRSEGKGRGRELVVEYICRWYLINKNTLF